MEYKYVPLFIIVALFAFAGAAVIYNWWQSRQKPRAYESKEVPLDSTLAYPSTLQQAAAGLRRPEDIRREQGTSGDDTAVRLLVLGQMIDQARVHHPADLTQPHDSRDDEDSLDDNDDNDDDDDDDDDGGGDSGGNDSGGDSSSGL